MLDGLMDLVRGGRAPEQERRLVAPTIGNTVVYSSDRAGTTEIFGNFENDAGATVTTKTAMRVSAVYACARLIAGAIAGLPLPIYRRDGQDREQIDHPFWWMLNEQPGAGWSASAFWEFVVWQMLMRGDGFAYIVRNRRGDPLSLIPHFSDCVHVERPRSADPRVPSRLKYYFSTDDGSFGADQDDVLHFTGFGFDGVRSLSVIQWGARNGIGIAMQGDKYAGTFFKSGGRPAIAIKVPGEFTPDQQERFRAAWIHQRGGTPGVDNIPFFLTEGLDIKELTMSAVDAQLLESRQWQVVDICRAFGVPPFMVGEMGKATYNNTENLGVDFVKYTLSPHLNRLNDELNIKLFRTATNFTEFNTNALMRGDSKARAEYYAKALGGTQSPAWMTPNEVRKLENLSPKPDGNTLSKPDAKAAGAVPGTDKKEPEDETESA